jgi:Na+-transporting methylmalonyl-CoA/oxaloacetate decarboxylase gamma subunit
MKFVDGIGFSLVAMSLVFGVLVALMLIIMLMGYIFKERKPIKEIKTQTIKEEVEVIEEIPVQDDMEIVAAIMAALSASLNVPTDKLAIKSIKRISTNNSNWRNR